MSYLELLSLSREPFSNSPDPDVFYGAQTHALCLNRLEIAIRLKRGLNVVLGRVGTGKSMLCRRLLKHLTQDEKLKVYCLLDAGGLSTEQFLVELCALFDCDWTSGDKQEAIGKLQSVVYDWVLVKGIYPVLLIDEGQKLSQDQLEILRVLLNFETNTEKLLQIVIFAQPEFQKQIDAMSNFRDRINEHIELETLSDEEGAALIQHRLHFAGGDQAVHLFDADALKVICRAAEGRPRQLIRLAHLSLLAMIMANQSTVTAKLVKTQVLKEPDRTPMTRGLWVGGLVVALGIAGIFYWQQTKDTHEKPAVEATVSNALPTVKTTVEAPKKPSKPSSNEAPTDKISEPSLTQNQPMHVGTDGKTVDIHEATKATEASSSADSNPNAQSPQIPPFMTSVQLGTHWPIEDVAMVFYSSESAVEALRLMNPDYELLKSTSIDLPLLTFDVPAQLKRNHQLAYAEFKSAQAAFEALVRWETLDGRFVLRVDPEGVRHYYVMARASFSDPNRAWGWLSQQKPPKDIRPLLLPPLRDTDVAYCDFKH